MAYQLLLVDDSVTMHKAVQITFAYEGFNVVTSASAAEALAKAKEGKFDVALVDVHLPGTDGYAVYLLYKDPAAATSQERPAAEKRLAGALAAAKLSGVRALKVIWADPQGGIAASDDVPLR